MTRDDFNNIIQQISRKLYGYAYRILENQHEAEDAVQETLLKLWKMNDKLDNYESVEALSATITKNYCIDQLRRRKSIIYDSLPGNRLIPESVPTPQELMERAESAMILNGIIGQLPFQQKEIIQLKDIQGLSYEEISEKTGQSVNNIRVTLSRARKFVREEYNKKRNDDGGA